MPDERNGMGRADEEPYGPDGVDVTLVRWMLSLTPAERLETLHGFLRSLRVLRHEDADT